MRRGNSLKRQGIGGWRALDCVTGRQPLEAGTEPLQLQVPIDDDGARAGSQV
jgi:hypothetical protein